jgi:molecular chaperone DnaK
VAFAHDARRWVGRVAKTQAVANPLRTVFSVKRRMGRTQTAATPEAPPETSAVTAPGASPEATPTASTVVASIKRQMGSDCLIEVDGRAYSPVEISAMILEKIKGDAEAHLGVAIERAVITVPAYFNDSQRRATRDAAAIAGLEAVRLVNEPTAAALAYGLDIEAAHTILVWDLGGGTFDVSILELGEGVFAVQAVNGNTRLGGDDYDQRLAQILTERFHTQCGIDLGGDPAARRLVRLLAEEAKIRLSQAAATRVVLPQAFSPEHASAVTLTRAELEQATADLTEQMAGPARRALADAGLDPMDLDRVVLVGGMTRMPAVRRLVRQVTGLEPYAHIDPDQVVALGAAIQAGVLAGQVRHVTLADVTALSLGIETQGGLFARMIGRNTPIPAAQNRLFTNARDDQASLDIHVLQGERELAADNMTLGRFELSGLTPQPRGEAKVEVVFDLDANGILQVSATDLHTDASRRIRVEPAGACTPADAQRLLAQSRARLESDRRQRADIETAIRAENLIRAAAELLEEASAAAPARALRQASAAVEEAVAAVQQALAAGVPGPIGAAAKTLGAALPKLSAALKSARAPVASEPPPPLAAPAACAGAASR